MTDITKAPELLLAQSNIRLKTNSNWNLLFYSPVFKNSIHDTG
ncbi:MAG: hypothetical protein QS748_01265 [Candidatus Endonucleobacter bathymodioli]|uniref:Uncharacterized protein n=1 Tax=Candidatus Endonucleibacter bathymodioli TaxID=539814 RepID=A0AA90NJW0_9GAMM|nr:hypothetical protein [Candidatus Endonucleobacter bathymodioli]